MLSTSRERTGAGLWLGDCLRALRNGSLIKVAAEDKGAAPSSPAAPTKGGEPECPRLSSSGDTSNPSTGEAEAGASL